MPDILVLWAAGMVPAALLLALCARFQPGSVQSRTARVKRLALLWPVALGLTLAAAVALLGDGLLALLVTTPADRRDARMQAAQAAVARAVEEAEASERELARITAELERRQSGEGALTAAVNLQSSASLSGTGSITCSPERTDELAGIGANWSDPDISAHQWAVLKMCDKHQ